jgi:hypothetical protein
MPEDLQVLVSDLVADSLGMEGFKRLRSHWFRVHRVLVAAFPRARMWTDYRDQAYSEAMIGQRVPPVLICGDNWLDGRNRVWAARQSGNTVVDCIDLAEIGVRVHSEELGRLVRFNDDEGMGQKYFRVSRPAV